MDMYMDMSAHKGATLHTVHNYVYRNAYRHVCINMCMVTVIHTDIDMCMVTVIHTDIDMCIHTYIDLGAEIRTDMSRDICRCI